MSKDYRYDAVSLMLKNGKVKRFGRIFEVVPKTTVYKALGVNFQRFNRAIDDPSEFTMDELFRLAEIFNVDPKLLVDIAFRDIVTRRKKKRKHPVK